MKTIVLKFGGTSVGTIDRIKNKYLDKISENDQNNFKDNLKIINNQIKQIENLVNEFSDFARMPKPIFKDNDVIKILDESIKLLSEIDKRNSEENA